MDWSEGATIKRLPKALRPAAIVVRNVKRAFETPAAHRADGITTVHNDGFRETAEFQRAYARAVRAAGWDYQIPYRVHQALWCAKNALRVPGDFVELGTGRGFFMSAVIEALGVTRPVHLFDTFLPNAIDGAAQTGAVSPYYATAFADVARNFSEWPNVTLHQGDVFETLPKADLKAVAFLHVDMNHPAPEIFGIRHLWPLMPTGAMMLLDDYAYVGFEAQHDAVDALAKDLGFNVLSTPTGQGIVVK
jgi:hypothetical protein